MAHVAARRMNAPLLPAGTGLILSSVMLSKKKKPNAKECLLSRFHVIKFKNRQNKLILPEFREMVCFGLRMFPGQGVKEVLGIPVVSVS